MDETSYTNGNRQVGKRSKINWSPKYQHGYKKMKMKKHDKEKKTIAVHVKATLILQIYSIKTFGKSGFYQAPQHNGLHIIWKPRC